MNYIIKGEEYIISTDKDKIDVEYVHGFLSQSYWSPGIPIETVKKAIENSLCFGIYHTGQQKGFARVVTDKATFAYIADVFIDGHQRGKGLSKFLMRTIMSHPELQNLRRIILATRDAHGLYSQFGFVRFATPERWMAYSQR